MQDISVFCSGRTHGFLPRCETRDGIKAAGWCHYTDRRLFLCLGYVGAVLTASLSPAAPIQLLETVTCYAGPGPLARRDDASLCPPRPHWRDRDPSIWLNHNQEGKRESECV